jgi:hypothetical protein
MRIDHKRIHAGVAVSLSIHRLVAGDRRRAHGHTAGVASDVADDDIYERVIRRPDRCWRQAQALDDSRDRVADDDRPLDGCREDDCPLQVNDSGVTSYAMKGSLA